MVDFKRRLSKKPTEKSVDPVELYDRLDRASDKGPLRPIQQAVLEEWHKTRRSSRDIILKLNTGQGKTLMGLLMLQSKLNEGQGPALYLCPNNFLVQQTAKEATQFGISCVTTDNELPDEFLDGKAVLIATIQKLFNGLSKFGIGAHYVPVQSILMDDAHACIQAIRDCCVIQLQATDNAYKEISGLFDDSLRDQGAGTYADIKRGESTAFLPVPYWDWSDRYIEVTTILSKHRSNNDIKFSWPILKDRIKDCLCIISGGSLEISPYLSPQDAFGSYHQARHRFFMSATVTDDSFLIKGLGIDADAIKNPLVHKDEKWSGEKMVLIPSLMDAKLTRESIVAKLGRPVANRKHGVVVLSPSFNSCKDWEGYGSIIAKKEDIDSNVQMLRERKCEKTVVIVNRYDGIDLPDDACRILILDMKPHPETLWDKYVENCRGSSDVVATKIARTIEQGMGRGVRGEKDYCVILILGPDLTRTVRSKETMQFLSPQSRKHIEIGVEVAQLAKDEISKGKNAHDALLELISQCLKRDDYWKEYYTGEMNKLPSGTPKPKMLDLFGAELAAEQHYQNARYDDAVSEIQRIINTWVAGEAEKAWYLQEIARYLYPKSKSESNKTQVAAHQKHRLLLKPKTGMTVTKLSITSQRRIENIIVWISRFSSHEEMLIAIDDITSNLRFHVEADKFEKALDELGKALGFECQRPDKEWKEGPDNLWALRDGEYLLIECKSEATLNRAEVYKDEAGQMHNACSWFDQNYPGARVSRVMIIPTLKLGRGAAFTDDVRAIRKDNLAKLVASSKAFFGEFKMLDLKDLSSSRVQELINIHNLSVDRIAGGYSEKFKLFKSD